MHYPFFRSYRALLLGALGCIALAACRPGGNAPAVAEATPAAISAPATTVIPATTAMNTRAALISPATADARLVPRLASPTAPGPPEATPIPPPVGPLSQMDIERLTAIARITPSPVPTAPSPTPPPRAARLPADQPWLLISDDLDQCGKGISTFRLIAIDRAGRLTQLERGVTAVAKRPGAPPLLATCAADGTAAIVDPVRWTRIRLALGPGVIVDQLMLSPDRKKALLRTVCWHESQCDDGRRAPENHILDLRTGTMLPSGGIPVSSGGGGPYSVSKDVQPLGWGAAGIYYTVTLSKAGGTTLNVMNPLDPLAGSRMVLQNLQFDLNIAREVLVYQEQMPAGYTDLILSDLRRGTRQKIDSARGFSSPVIAPDGTALVYFRTDQNPYTTDLTPHAELVLFDIVRNTKTVLNDTLGTPVGTGGYRFDPPTRWSQDSQLIVAITQSPPDQQQASLLARDGTLINTVPQPESSVFGLTADDQLVIDTQYGHGVSWLPLRAGAAPYAPPVTLPDQFIWDVFLPPGGADAHSTAATPLPVTQLPTPAVPTPLPAVPAAITRLGDVPGDAQFFPYLPVYRHVLYRVRGSFYSQALRGGPAAFLGGDDQYWTNNVFISPDGNDLIYQLSDGVYHVPLVGGKRERLTPALPSGDGVSIGYAQVSPDGGQVVYAVTGPKPAAWKNRLQRDSIWTVALYSVPVTGGTPVRLTPPLDPDSDISGFTITSDNRRVIYSVDVPDPNFPLGSDGGIATRTVALYSVPLTGGPSIRLAESTSETDPIAGQMLTDDGQYVLYQPRSTTALFSVSVTGGPAVQLSAPGGEQITRFWASADHRYALYQTGTAIYAVPIGGGTAVNLTGAAGAEGVFGALLTPDGTQLVFRTRTALYRVPLGGGPVTRLAALLSSDTADRNGLFIADGRVVYQHEDTIYSVPVTGGADIRLTAPLSPGTQLHMGQPSPDSRYVVYMISGGTNQPNAIYSVPIGGGPAVGLLSDPGGEAALYTISDGYAIGTAGSTLYAAPLAGGPRLQLSAASTMVTEWPVVSADGRQVIYMARRAGQSSTDRKGLYVVTLPARQP